MVEEKPRWRYVITFPILLFVLYLAFDFFLQMLFYGAFGIDAGWTSFISYGLVIVLVGIWMYHVRDDFKEAEKYNMSAAGVLFLILMFIIIYISAESFGNWLRVAAPYGLTDAYNSLADTNLILYIILSVTLAPFAEEMIYRWMLYHTFRERLSVWPAFIISTGIFTAMHGTIMHIPVAVGLSLFIVVIYEVTKKFYWCIIIHAAFNFCSMFLVFAFEYTPLGWIITWFVAMVVMVLLYQFRDTVFYKWFRPGTFDRMEDVLDEKRQNLGLNSEDFDDKKIEK